MSNYIENLIKLNYRPDKRGFLDYRQIKVTENPSKYAEGSVILELGNTKVVAGVKMDVGEPFKDTPDKGVLITGAEFIPFASKDFESGPPSPEAIELARVVDRGIRGSNAVDFKNLCITPGEKVWMIFVDLYILSHDGNLVDAAGLAALYALLKARLPKLDKEGNVVREEYSGKLPLINKPIPITFYKVMDKVLVDATKEEEESSTARLTVIFDSESNINGMQKANSGFWTIDEIKSCLSSGKEISERLRNEVFNI